jgi:hypothetical protein
MRGMSFMGDALAHGVLPGIAVAFLLGGNLLLGAAISAAVMIGGVTLASARSRLGDDTAIGLLFVGMLALGVAIISARGAYAGDLTTILFGDPIGVTRADLHTCCVATLTLVRDRRCCTGRSSCCRSAGPRPGARPAPGPGAPRDARADRDGDRQLVPHGRHAAGVRLPRRAAGDGVAGRPSGPGDDGCLDAGRQRQRGRRPTDQLPLRHRDRGHDRRAHRAAVLRRADLREAVDACGRGQRGDGRAMPSRPDRPRRATWRGPPSVSARRRCRPAPAVRVDVEVPCWSLASVGRAASARSIAGGSTTSSIRPHTRADHVVVVLRQLLGQLVAGDVVGRGEALDRAALLQDREVAVQRALRLRAPSARAAPGS